MQLRNLLVPAVALAALPVAVAWGAVGHEVIATIAQIHLHPTVLPAMCTVLNYTSRNPDEPQCHLAPVATWADKLRFKMRWSAAMHYIGSLGDYPPSACLFPGNRGWEGTRGNNVLSAIRNDSNILQAWVTGALSAREPDRGVALANEALKFFIHFVGDMHQPLHLTGRDRGGNSDKVLFDSRETNLHSVWDTLLISKSLRTMGRNRNYTCPLPSRQIEYNLRQTIYDPYVRRIMWEGILGRWKDEIPSWLSCPPRTQSSPTSESFPFFVAGIWQKSISFWNSLTGTADETDDDILCPYHWAQPIHKLNCDIVWPKELDEPPYKQHAVSPHQVEPTTNNEFKGKHLELDTPKYAGAIAEDWIIEKLLAQAGIRLAAMLNWLFADPQADGLLYTKFHDL